MQNGANLNPSEPDDVVPLKSAIEKGDIAAVKFLIKNKAKIDVNLLNLALKEQKDQLAKDLILEGAPLVPGNSSDDNPLRIAAQNNDLPMVKLLLEHGASTTSKDAKGDTPLHLAAKNNNLPMVKLLVDHGEEPNALNDLGLFALDNVADKYGALYKYLSEAYHPISYRQYHDLHRWHARRNGCPK